jgi:hypothetical protein
MARSLPLCTALILGEGKAEAVFLTHLKSLYLPRGCGTTLQVKPGFGKGGRGVLEYAIQLKRSSEFDLYLVLLDTDTDWDDVQRKLARKAAIVVIESEPCLECWLLQIHGVAGERNSAGHKAEFARRFGKAAHDPAVYAAHFSRALLDAARQRVVPLRELLCALNVAE